MCILRLKKIAFWILVKSITKYLKGSILIYWRRQWDPTPVLLPGEPHGRRSLVGFSPWGHWVRPDWATSLWLFTFMPWRRKWQHTPMFLLGESQGRGSLVGCSPWGHYESGTTEQLHFHFSLSCIGEGNGNPCQCSCLENPRDGGAWWAAVYGVSQSRTWLKWLSSSSSLINMCLLCFLPWV